MEEEYQNYCVARSVNGKNYDTRYSALIASSKGLFLYKTYKNNFFIVENNHLRPIPLWKAVKLYDELAHHHLEFHASFGIIPVEA